MINRFFAKNILHGYVDDSGSTVKFKMFYVDWTSVRSMGNKLPTRSMMLLPEGTIF